MIQFQEYLSSDYPGFASFIDTIIKPIFGDGFRPDADLQEMIEYPDEIEEFDLISNSHDEDFRQLAQDCNVTRLLKLGVIRTSNGIPIHVYDITVGSRKLLARNRKGIQEIIRRNSEMTNQTGAFMLFHYADTTWEWRFSYCYVGRNREDTTSAKRYTYLLGRGQSCKTAALRFQTLLKKKGKIAMDDITEAFSVESVSKEFFDQYRLNYADIVCYVTGKRMVKAGGKWEEKQEHEPNEFIMNQFAQFADPEKAVRDYVKKLMGRLVFLQFIQKKGWLGVPMDDASWTKGDKEFIQHLFAQYENKDTFIDDVLEPLFNDINTRRADDKANSVLGNDIKVPYLNGGLFDKDAEDDTIFPLPSKYMQDMLDFFSAYNFTIDENDPNDAEVGVDPEMLGRVFENLLEDNKDKGAFYTPKEIVQYMCRESLIAYLQTDIEDDVVKQSFRDFVTTHEVSTLNPADVFKVDKKLREVKICDPAIGSGAFPMGLLKELFDCRMAIEGEEEGKTPAEIKKDIIQNSIYGVDIEKGAVDIARLRFWLSLIIDEQTPHALPNMDFKIMQGNSLLEQYMGVPLDDIYDSSRQMMLAFDEETTARMLLKEHMFTYFEKEDHEEKAETLKSIDNAVKAMVKAKTLGNPEVSAAIDALNLRNNQEFFLWHTWFNDVLADKKDAKGKQIKGSGGFDIVIGNPPYIQLQADNGYLGNLYKPCKFETFASMGDIYCLFYEQGCKLLKTNGHLCFITSNKWMRTAYGKKTRSFFAKKTNPKLIVDFGNLDVFETATVVTNILLLQNSKNKGTTICCSTDKQPKHILSELSFFVESNSSNVPFLDDEPWSILTPEELTIKKKMEKKGITIKDSDLSINYGVKTGYNDAFIISKEDKDNLLSSCTDCEEKARTAELIKPMLRGRDINRYVNSDNNLSIIFIPWHFPLHFDESIQGASDRAENEFAKVYPTLYAHLLNHKDALLKRNKAETGIRYEWYAMQRWGAKYWKDFDKEKIVWGNLNLHPTYSYAAKGVVISAPCTMITPFDKTVFAILNSKLGDFYIRQIGVTRNGGYFEYKPMFVEQLPIANATITQKKEIESLVDRILSAKKSNPQADTSAEEQEIDQLIYKLYNLTPEEIAIVEGKNE